MNLEHRKALPCPSTTRHIFRGDFASRVHHASLLLAFALIPLFMQSCGVFTENRHEPDTVSETRAQLIDATGGFICLYREGANPVDLLYVMNTANEAGLQVVFRIADSSVIPEAIRKGWGDVAVGYTEAEAKKLGLRVIPLPRAENEFREDAGTNILLLRSADDYLDNLLNPDKRNMPPSASDVIPLP